MTNKFGDLAIELEITNLNIKLLHTREGMEDRDRIKKQKINRFTKLQRAVLL